MINIVYICSKLYPGQIELGNISFRQLEKIVIGHWVVPNVEQPTEEYLESLFPEYQRQFDIDAVANPAVALIQKKLDDTAKSKSYDNAISCASFSSSSNLTWTVQADPFVAWRDAVWNYAYTIFAQVEAGTIPIPTLEEFMAGLPQISW
jgi:hypothetical protein